VLLKNIQEAKFQAVLVPIAQRLLSPEAASQVSFDMFFTHILVHELAHGIGPHNIQVDGEKTTVRAQLTGLYLELEEAKADIVGLWGMHQWMDQGHLDASQRDSLDWTFVASGFRTLRFGVKEAHGKGMCIQFNWLMDHGGLRIDSAGQVQKDAPRFREAARLLAKEILELQAHGDRSRAEALVKQYGGLRPELAKLLERLGDVPLDIAPRYVTAEELLLQKRPS
jgi:hypothetical protein